MVRFLLVFLFIFFILPLAGRLLLSLAAFFLLRASGAPKNRSSQKKRGDVIDVSGKVVR